MVAVLALLTACATQPAVVGRVDSVEVDKVVQVSCIDPEQFAKLPPLPAKVKVPEGLDSKQKAALVGIELDSWRRYGAIAHPMILGCRSAVQPATQP